MASVFIKKSIGNYVSAGILASYFAGNVLQTVSTEIWNWLHEKFSAIVTLPYPCKTITYTNGKIEGFFCINHSLISRGVAREYYFKCVMWLGRFFNGIFSQRCFIRWYLSCCELPSNVTSHHCTLFTISRHTVTSSWSLSATHHCMSSVCPT